jgi:hypothetical protein
VKLDKGVIGTNRYPKDAMVFNIWDRSSSISAFAVLVKNRDTVQTVVNKPHYTVDRIDAPSFFERGTVTRFVNLYV